MIKFDRFTDVFTLINFIQDSKHAHVHRPSNFSPNHVDLSLKKKEN